jgi:DnaJ-class molecular chaperone
MTGPELAPNRRKASPVMATTVQTCAACGGSGTVTTSIYNTVTHTWNTFTETCLACNGTGSR